MKTVFALLITALGTWSVGCIQNPEAPQPNIILIMTDDLGWGDVGFNGHPHIKTPHLDRLAAQGVVFDRFYSASAVCSPTRASVLTGRHPTRLGIMTANSGHMLEEELTIAELLTDAGYATGHFGKWHLGTLTTSIRDSNRGRPDDSTHFSLPTSHGFDQYFSTEAKVPTFDPMIKPAAFDTLRGEGLRYGWATISEGQSWEAYGTSYWTSPEIPVSENLEGHNSRVIMDRVLPFIDQAVSQQQAFFTVIWFHTPHLPVVADERLRGLYPDYSHEEQIYYGTITGMDEQVGRLWAHLDALKITENTMLWFASDNGPEDRTPGSAGPFRERKRSLYEGGVRVPAFVHWTAGIKGGRRIEVPAVTSDYLSTIAEYLDIPVYPERTLDGISLVDILAGKKVLRNTPIGFHFHEKRAWVTDTHKLISTNDGKTYELYDLINDPGEMKDIIQGDMDLAKVLQDELDEWLVSIESDRKGLTPTSF